MRINVKVIILVVVGILVGLFFLYSSAQGYTCYKPESIPFTYDPNAPAHKVIGAISITAGKELRERIVYNDPDDDPITATTIACPTGFVVEGQGKDWFIKWAPQLDQLGIHYVDIKIVDVPQGGDPLSDSGTILIMVYKPNSAPFLRWLCSCVLFITNR